MANFAVIESNTVGNVITADSLEIAEMVTGRKCVDITETLFAIGDIWDGTQLIKVQEIPNA
jgi:hypothetical protein